LGFSRPAGVAPRPPPRFHRPPTHLGWGGGRRPEQSGFRRAAFPLTGSRPDVVAPPIRGSGRFVAGTPSPSWGPELPRIGGTTPPGRHRPSPRARARWWEFSHLPLLDDPAGSWEPVAVGVGRFVSAPARLLGPQLGNGVPTTRRPLPHAGADRNGRSACGWPDRRPNDVTHVRHRRPLPHPTEGVDGGVGAVVAEAHLRACKLPATTKPVRRRSCPQVRLRHDRPSNTRPQRAQRASKAARISSCRARVSG